MRPEDIDRLAAFCRLSERGYFQWDSGYWGTRPMDEWRPHASHDDWQMVAEEAERRGLLDMLLNVLNDTWISNHTASQKLYDEWFMLLKPAEKCEAMLRVLDTQTPEASDK